MRRTVWFSIICLFVVALVAGGKIWLPTVKPAAKVVEKYEPADDEIGVKGDKLEALETSEGPQKVTVQTVKVVPEIESSSAEQSKTIVATENWRPSFASVRKRVRHVRHRHRWKLHHSRR